MTGGIILPQVLCPWPISSFTWDSSTPDSILFHIQGLGFCFFQSIASEMQLFTDFSWLTQHQVVGCEPDAWSWNHFHIQQREMIIQQSPSDQASGSAQRELCSLRQIKIEHTKWAQLSERGSGILWNRHEMAKILSGSLGSWQPGRSCFQSTSDSLESDSMALFSGTFLTLHPKLQCLMQIGIHLLLNLKIYCDSPMGIFY